MSRKLFYLSNVVKRAVFTSYAFCAILYFHISYKCIKILSIELGEFNTLKYEFSQKKKKKRKKEQHLYVHNLSNPVKKLSAFKFLFSDNFFLKRERTKILGEQSWTIIFHLKINKKVYGMAMSNFLKFSFGDNIFFVLMTDRRKFWLQKCGQTNTVSSL